VVVVRRHVESDNEAVRHIYAEAFRREDDSGGVPPEVGLFEALTESHGVADGLSFVALRGAARPIGHVTASRASVGLHAVVAVGPIGVLPEDQGRGIGSALMHAVLGGADALDVPMVVLLGAPQYYRRFGFQPAAALGVVSPEPRWGDAFQARLLHAYTPSVAGLFAYGPAFSAVS
jgi:putative acetyltransferase